MRRRVAATAGVVAMALVLVAGLSSGGAATAQGGFSLVRIGSFAPDSPTYVAAPSGDVERLFVVVQQGRIRVVRNGAILPTPFLTLTVACCGERGLLSMAFAPDYLSTGLFYVYYTAPGGALTIDEFRRSSNPDVADPASRRNVLTIPHPRGNHNGGQLQFGPRGYLYVGTGDGGGTGDPDLAGQNLTTLLGKILRIDPRLGPGSEPYTIPPDNPFVGQPPRRPEIWSYGLRNPWRFSFDRQTGDLVIADVGQDSWEEIDFAPAVSGYGRAVNFGWSCREGRHDYNPAQPLCMGPPAPSLTEPVWEYPHARGCSITGGYVVRDPMLPALFGRYVYGDACTAPLWSIVLRVPDALDDAATGEQVSSLFSFGEDACARVYAASGNGPVYRLTATPPPPTTACAPVGPPPAPPPPSPPAPPPAPPSPPPVSKTRPKPRYQAVVRTTHPRAIRNRSRNWTYRGDTVRVAFRNAAAPAGARRRYTVCYTRNRLLACSKRTLRGRRWDAWKLRIRRPWAGYVRGRYRRYVEFNWRVSGRVVVRKRIWVYK